MRGLILMPQELHLSNHRRFIPGKYVLRLARPPHSSFLIKCSHHWVWTRPWSTERSGSVTRYFWPTQKDIIYISDSLEHADWNCTMWYKNFVALKTVIFSQWVKNAHSIVTADMFLSPSGLMPKTANNNVLHRIETHPNWPAYADIIGQTKLKIPWMASQHPGWSDVTSVDNWTQDRKLAVVFCGLPHPCNLSYHVIYYTLHQLHLYNC